MGVLADNEINKLLIEGKLVIGNYSDSSLNPASYDLRLGESAYISSDQDPRTLRLGEVLTLKPSEFALVTTYEVLELPDNIIGQVGLKARYSLSGLMNISGIQVEPGFRGRLVLGIVNLSTKTRKIAFCDKVFTIQFHKLDSSVTKSYKGSLYAIDGIPADLMEKIENKEFLTHYELMNKVELLENSITHRIEKLENLVRWVIIGGFGTIAVIILQAIFK